MALFERVSTKKTAFSNFFKKKVANIFFSRLSLRSKTIFDSIGLNGSVISGCEGVGHSGLLDPLKVQKWQNLLLVFAKNCQHTFVFQTSLSNCPQLSLISKF